MTMTMLSSLHPNWLQSALLTPLPPPHHRISRPRRPLLLPYDRHFLTPPMDADPHSPAPSHGSRTPTRSISVLPTLQIPWSPTQVQPVPAHLPIPAPGVGVTATALGPPVVHAAGSPIVSQPTTPGSNCEDMEMNTLQPALSPGDWVSFPLEIDLTPSVLHDQSYATPAPTPASPMLLSQEANARDLALTSFPSHPNLDGIVFSARDTIKDCMLDMEQTRIGYASYVLQEPLSVSDETDIPVSPELLRQATNIVIGALSAGPLDSTGADVADVYRCLAPSSWFHLATAVLAGITRGSVCTTLLRQCRDFPFEPCLNSMPLPPGAFPPATQSDAIRLLLSQLVQEFDVCCRASGLTDAEMKHLKECHWPLFI